MALRTDRRLKLPITRRVLLGAGSGIAAGSRSVPLARANAAPTPGIKPLAIGAIFPLSGTMSQLGDESLRGVELAVMALNEAGGLFGRPLALLRGDAPDPAAATAEAHRLIATEGVGMLFGSYASPVATAASAVSELAGIPYVELDAAADALTARGLKLLVRTGPTAGAKGALAVDALADLLAPRWGQAPEAIRFAIINEDGPDGSAAAAGAQARAKSLGLPAPEAIAYGAGTLNFAPMVARLRAVGAQVVLHAAAVEDVVPFHGALQQAHWQPGMVIGSGGGYALRDMAQTLGSAFAGVLVAGVTPYRVSPVVAPGAAAVAADYQRRYGAPPRSGHSLICHAGARLVLEIAARAGGVDAARLRPALAAADIADRSTEAGWGLRLDATGQNVRAVPYLAQWQGSELVTVAPPEAAVAPMRPLLGG